MSFRYALCTALLLGASAEQTGKVSKVVETTNGTAVAGDNQNEVPCGQGKATCCKEGHACDENKNDCCDGTTCSLFTGRTWGLCKTTQVEVRDTGDSNAAVSTRAGALKGDNQNEVPCGLGKATCCKEGDTCVKDWNMCCDGTTCSVFTGTPPWGVCKAAQGDTHNNGDRNAELVAGEDGANTHLSLASTPHYENPEQGGVEGCRHDENLIRFTNDGSLVCAATCSIFHACPTDVPSGVSATPHCALHVGGSIQQFCGLVCEPHSTHNECGTDAFCKEHRSIYGSGMCVYHNATDGTHSLEDSVATALLLV